MNLLIDIGNTRLKWALSDSGRIVRTGAVDASLWLDLEAVLVCELKGKTLSRVLVSSVAKLEIAEKVGDWSENFAQLTPGFAKVRRSFHGVTVSYKKLENLGVDRWLAMLAARERTSRNTLVIDAGTTITADFLDHTGCHQGGLIVPGIAMMRKGLFERTAAVKVDSLNLSYLWQPGCDTLPCVSNGISAMLTGFLQQITDRVQCDGFDVLVTGGDAETIVSFLSADALTCPNLVLEGLMLLE